LRVPGIEVALAGAALVAATAALWLTLDTDFLAHPEWLAVQKADFILGPVLTGLYWMRRRPGSRFGPMLVAFGFLNLPYVLHSSSVPWLFSIGLLWENVIGFAIYVLIVAFPHGRLDVPARLILGFTLLFAVIPAIAILLLLPQVGAGGSISQCLTTCPHNGLAIANDPTLALDLWNGFRYAVIAAAVATAGLLVWRFLMGTPPQRRARAVGTPIALVFLVLQVAFHVLALTGADAGLQQAVAWAFAGARAAVWYGFLFALIAAQLFAGRALARLLGRSMGRPSREEVQELLRESLGDPGLELAFPDERTGAWGDAGAPSPSPGRTVTLVQRDGRVRAELRHDAQLDDDPELLQAAGVVALLVQENTELDAAWREALGDLRRSRARIVRAGDEERRRIERDLHDGVQQRLVAIRVRLGLAADRDAPRRDLESIATDVEDVLEEVRDVGHGLFPPVLVEWGIVTALERLRLRTAVRLDVAARGVERYPRPVEAAVYYCCVEAIANATKHGGPSVQVSVRLREQDGHLLLEVGDDGRGFDPVSTAGGSGLTNMQDRLGALDGRLSVTSSPGAGTVVSGSVPLQPVHAGPRPERDPA
jgi:signal transduction histidine kinase